MAPSCLIINFTSGNTDWIRELLLGSTEKLSQLDSWRGPCDSLLLGSADQVDLSDVWKIETKYYKADVQLQFVDCDDMLSVNKEEDVQDTEAVIFNCVNSKFCLGE